MWFCTSILTAQWWRKATQVKATQVKKKAQVKKKRKKKEKKIVTSFLSDLKVWQIFVTPQQQTADSRQQQQRARFGDGFSPSKNYVYKKLKPPEVDHVRILIPILSNVQKFKFYHLSVHIFFFPIPHTVRVPSKRPLFIIMITL